MAPNLSELKKTNTLKAEQSAILWKQPSLDVKPENKHNNEGL